MPIELLKKMTSYFLGLRNLLCRSLGLKFETNHFWAQEKSPMMIPIQDLLEWPHVLKT